MLISVPPRILSFLLQIGVKDNSKTDNERYRYCKKDRQNPVLKIAINLFKREIYHSIIAANLIKIIQSPNNLGENEQDVDHKQEYPKRAYIIVKSLNSVFKHG